MISGRLVMSHWHENDNWKNKPVEKIINECGTTHCVAGWLQIFEKDKYNNIETREAGLKIAPNLGILFDETEAVVEAVINTLHPNK